MVAHFSSIYTSFSPSIDYAPILWRAYQTLRLHSYFLNISLNLLKAFDVCKMYDSWSPHKPNYKVDCTLPLHAQLSCRLQCNWLWTRSKEMWRPNLVVESLSVKKRKEKNNTFVCFCIHEFEPIGSTMNKISLVSIVKFNINHFGG